MNAQVDAACIEKLKALLSERHAEVEDFVDFRKARRKCTRDEAARRLADAFASLDAHRIDARSRPRWRNSGSHGARIENVSRLCRVGNGPT
ncbi:MAG TPA: hypothetical protein VMB48_00690 [Steroidobacteraceae bacterium]|nr:hypothetical protein [Steroidobacteraceae bacterium]